MGYRVCGRFECPQRAVPLLGQLRIGPDHRHVDALPRGADSRGGAAPVVKQHERRCLPVRRITIGRSQIRDVPGVGTEHARCFWVGCGDGRKDGWVLSRVRGLTHDSPDQSVPITHCRPLARDGALSVPGRRSVSR
ncbi:hypothetical protein [Streptomyces rectiverticillatus]|uniref:hypothetical protein n=1 Tax=Streptomyces rectiverticillatus TaxID=173860 RepID=UPI003CCD8A09